MRAMWEWRDDRGRMGIEQVKKEEKAEDGSEEQRGKKKRRKTD